MVSYILESKVLRFGTVNVKTSRILIKIFLSTYKISKDNKVLYESFCGVIQYLQFTLNLHRIDSN
jgi:hypothetical protein